jgi:hypothetical protein
MAAAHKAAQSFPFKEMCDVAKSDVAIFGVAAGIVGLRQPHACADSRANVGSASPTYGSARIGTHESRADGSQCASDKRTTSEYFGGGFLCGGQTQSNPDQHHGLALCMAGQLRDRHALR